MKRFIIFISKIIFAFIFIIAAVCFSLPLFTDASDGTKKMFLMFVLYCFICSVLLFVFAILGLRKK